MFNHITTLEAEAPEIFPEVAIASQKLLLESGVKSIIVRVGGIIVGVGSTKVGVGLA